ncbi:ankyrin repeat domain-containing protein [Endozoicomonas sp. ONNA2]|uniref:ankyrin repeat domain-containing protein n=1 Tax=Endozoicomonas sp. ONNA2 TaxID=2828741 RepID=UPI0021477ED4|nr:ankyrin repeat domain-containing protein [Endozoicomonas sp. ONNA2]
MDVTAGCSSSVPPDSSAPTIFGGLDSVPGPNGHASFQGNDVVPVFVITHCGHRLDLNGIVKDFSRQLIGKRKCSVCQEDPMPLVDEPGNKCYLDAYFPDPSFYQACVFGCLPEVHSRLCQGVNVNIGIDGVTALMFAAQSGQWEVAELLMECGAEVNAGKGVGFTALMMASEHGHQQVAKLLIDKDADIDAAMEDGFTALMFACQNGHWEVVRMLAAQYGHLEILRQLIDSNAEVNAAMENGATALILASTNGHLRIVELLINRGADVNASLNNGSNAMMLAARNGHPEVAEFLGNVMAMEGKKSGYRKYTVYQ